VISLVSFKDLSDKFVICAGGFDLGQVNGVEMNTGTWQVTHLHVKLSKTASEDLRFKKKNQQLNRTCTYRASFHRWRQHTTKQIP
jgi:sporulation protein YlmC with PRC-barrel domain